MRKKIFKVAAILVCFAFLTISIPGLVGAERKAPKYDAKLLLKKPLLLLQYIFPIFGSIFDSGNSDTSSKDSSDNSSSGKIKPTADSTCVRPSDSD